MYNDNITKGSKEYASNIICRYICNIYNIEYIIYNTLYIIYIINVYALMTAPKYMMQ